MTTGQPIPFSEEAERGVLGAALLDANRVTPLLATAGVTDGWFYVPANRLVAGAILDMAKHGQPVDALTVSEELKTRGQGGGLGGVSYLDKLIDDTPTAAHAEYYLGIVRLKWLLRRTLEVAREAETCALAPDATEEVVAGAQAGFATLMDDAARGRAEASNLDVMCDSVRAWKDAFENKVPAIGLQTPWAALTEMCCGLEPGIFILAGRPSAGKTTIEDQICCELARDGVPVARATLDSTRKSLLERAIARKAGVSLPKMKFGYAGEGSVAKAQEAADSIGKYPLFIRDDLRTVGGICSWFRAMVLKHGVKLLTVDYIQLIGAPEMGRSEWDANTRVSYVSGQLKKLSLSLGVPMLVLSQLNRGAANDEREPELNDLRDSGALEQDAEKVAMVFIDVEKRNEMDKSKPGTTKKIRPIRIALKKHKNGETGTLCYWMYPPYFRLEEVENFDGATPPEEGLMGGRSSEKATEPAEFKSGAPDWYPSEDGE